MGQGGRARPGTGVRHGAWLLGQDRRQTGLWSETCGCQLHLRPESGRVDDRKLPLESFLLAPCQRREGWWGLSTQSSGAELLCPFFPAGLRVGRDRAGVRGSRCWRRHWSQGLIRKCGRTCRGRASWAHGSPGPSAYLCLRPSKRLEELSRLCVSL